jgi:hypothetical protein
VRPEEADEPAEEAHYRRGVSNATGRMTSSGVTPPCRKEPR